MTKKNLKHIYLSFSSKKKANKFYKAEGSVDCEKKKKK